MSRSLGFLSDVGPIFFFRAGCLAIILQTSVARFP